MYKKTFASLQYLNKKRRAAKVVLPLIIEKYGFDEIHVERIQNVLNNINIWRILTNCLSRRADPACRYDPPVAVLKRYEPGCSVIIQARFF